MPGKRSPEARARRIAREAERQAVRLAQREQQRAYVDCDDFAGRTSSFSSIDQTRGFKRNASGFRTGAPTKRKNDLTHLVREPRTERVETADATGAPIEVVTTTALVEYGQSRLKQKREGKITAVATRTERKMTGHMVNGELQSW